MSRRSWALACAALALLVGLAVLWLSNPAPPPDAAAAQGGSDPHAATARQDEPAAPSAASPARGAAPQASPTVAARRADRPRADAIRKHVAERRAQAAAGSAPSSAARPADHVYALARPAPAPEADSEALRRRDYIRRAVQGQYFPVARSCYEELLAREPTAAGKIVLYFSIVGDADAGGVVNDVELKDGTTIDDPEFTTCMRESMYSTVFEPPPPGASETTVQFPIELHP